MALTVTVDDLRPELVLLTLSGAVDAATAPQVSAALEPFLLRTGTIIVLDLDDLLFIDSAGLGVLITIQRHLRSIDSELRLTRVPAHVENLLRITALDQALPVHAPATGDDEEPAADPADAAD